MSDPRLLDDKLRLEEEIGRGAMGVVWRARNLALDSSVAVKLLAGGEVDDGTEGRQRFEREARAVAGLNSPHIVKVFDFGLDAGRPYFVMELLEGEDLGRRLDREVCLPLLTVQQIVEQVCRGLTVAHAAGVVHRDLKPENLFLLRTPDDAVQVKILDFGVAKQLDPPEKGMTMTQSGTLVGTPFYMSPEQILAPRDIDERTDLWSLAVVTYAMLTGAVPFDGETIGALSIAIHGGQFEAPTKLREGLPSALDAWFARAFQQMPDDRFESAEELAITFADACRDRAPHVFAITHEEPTEAGAPTERLPLAAQKTRRRRRQALGVAIAMASGLGGAVIARQSGRTASEVDAAKPPVSVTAPVASEAPPTSLPAPPPPSVSEPAPEATASVVEPPVPTPVVRPPPRRARPRILGNLGDACVAPEQCSSGYCTDGVCCDSHCSPSLACRSCSVGTLGGRPRGRGRCGDAPVGSNPRGGCLHGQGCSERRICTRLEDLTSP